MEVVFFIYGLAFFILGFAVLLYPKKGSSFALAKSIKLIAGFGILHGINEWLDMFLLINEHVATSIDPLALEIIRMATLPISFAYLVHFGVRILKLKTSKPHTYRYYTLGLTILWMIVFLCGERNFLMWDVWSRYILCIPGSFLTGLALLLYVPQVEQAKVRNITFHLKMAGISFIAYAILAGAIVKNAGFFPASVLNYDWFISQFGMPVQVLRSICAVFMAYSLIRVLEIFRWEVQRDLKETRLHFDAVAAQLPIILFTTDRDLRITFIEGNGLEALSLKPNALPGKDMRDVFEAGADDIAETCGKALQGQDMVTTIRAGGCVFQMFYGPLKTRDGIDGTIGVAIDISAEKQAQEELNEYRDRMNDQRTLAELGTVSTEMVQKLSVPVASTKAFMLTAMVALRKIQGGGKLKEPLEKGLTQASQAMEIIESFYNFANIQPSPQADPVDIEQIVQRILAVFRDKISNYMLRVETLGIDIAPRLYISSKELEQIFFVLIQNVVQSADGPNVNDFKMKCYVGDGNLKLQFRDNCGSISYDDPNEAFEPFTKPSGPEKSYSFGLAVIKRLVLAYDGTITARKHGAETIVEISLPANGQG